MSGVRRVGCDPTCTPPGPRGVQVLDGWKPAASHLLCGADDALQPQSVSGGGSSVPHGDGGGEDGLDDGRVELHQHLGGQLELLTTCFIRRKVLSLILKLEKISASQTQIWSWFHMR